MSDSTQWTAIVRRRRQEAVATLSAFTPELDARIAEGAHLLREAVSGDRRIMACGNGGSAADAEHFVAELVGRFERERAPLPALALTASSPLLTALANDLGYENAFERQVRAWARAGDVLLALSTSGNSHNVLRAAGAAREAGAKVIALSGRTGGRMAGACDLLICVPSDRTARIQEAHGLILHTWAELLELE
jgi:D-sedoheptulose 7-phosphate isomerase